MLATLESSVAGVKDSVGVDTILASTLYLRSVHRSSRCTHHHIHLTHLDPLTRLERLTLVLLQNTAERRKERGGMAAWMTCALEGIPLDTS